MKKFIMVAIVKIFSPFLKPLSSTVTPSYIYLRAINWPKNLSVRLWKDSLLKVFFKMGAMFMISLMIYTDMYMLEYSSISSKFYTILDMLFYFYVLRLLAELSIFERIIYIFLLSSKIFSSSF